MSELKIVTFNIRCFGFDGDYFARSRSESRISYLKDFIKLNYSDADVFILQEIMDISILNLILPEGFKFYSYSHDYPRHMHVVLACRKEFDFIDVKTIENTSLDTTKSRPVLYGKLVKDSTPLAHIIGLHLKSGFEHTDKRIKQCEAISMFLNNLNKSHPILIAGDFNSHFKTRTKKEFDDLVYLKTIFEGQLNLEDHMKKTYVLPTEDAQLDHFWTSFLNIKQIEVYEMEKYTLANALKNYYREISDHLPVKIILKI